MARMDLMFGISEMGWAAGRPVRPSYSFMGVYYNEANLLPHRDNHQCE